MGRVVQPAWLRRRCVLSALQRRVVELLAGIPEAAEFVLAGGAALIALGEVDRSTRDLDYFAVEPAAVDRLAPMLASRLESAGLDIVHERVAPGFVRLVVSDGDEQTRVDLASDARVLPPVRGPVGPTLSVAELATDKVLAIFGRAEARDFVDLAALEPRFGLARLLELAERKDAGFRREIFAAMLQGFDRLDRDEFDVAENEYQNIVSSVRRWRAATEPSAD